MRVMGKAKQQLDQYAGITSLSVADQTFPSAIDVKHFLNNHAEENGDIGKLRFIRIQRKQATKRTQGDPVSGSKSNQTACIKRKQTSKTAGERKSLAPNADALAVYRNEYEAKWKTYRTFNIV
jgi:hypothetical protein